MRNRGRSFVARERDRPFEASRPRDENPDAAPERVRGDPGFVRLRKALPGGRNGRLDALPAGGGDPAPPGCTLSRNLHSKMEPPANTFGTAVLGRTGLRVGRLGVAAGYGVPADAVERAFERGANYFF
jgi:hypothetical protein